MNKYNIVINADMGESFGRYKLGNDEELMKYVTSANFACGFHGGDPTAMRTAVKLAKKYDIAVGAHPGFQDLKGFGRRMIEVSPEELADDLLYQLGALEAFIRVEGIKMWHVFPHGKLYPLVSGNEEHAEAYIDTIRKFNPEVIVMAEETSLLARKAKRAGLRFASFAVADLGYDSVGNIIIERVKRPSDPAVVAQQAVSIVKYNKLKAIDGTELEMQADALVFHGDAPNSVEVLKKVRQEFEKEGIDVTKW